MSSEILNDKNALVAFDGLDIRSKIRQSLQNSGIFTDQNYEGSNLSAFNDTVAMVFSLLLYNLNKTSANSQFSITKLYELMNGIVKELDYKPVGYQTATLSFSLTSTDHDVGSFMIPRFSYVTIGGISYSLVKDLPFSKKRAFTPETIFELGTGGILYQGKPIEYPIYKSLGLPNETITITPKRNDEIIDNFNIYVFVKTMNGQWEEWDRVSSAYLYNATDKVFEVRYNEKQKYEIKFGNNINGKQLDENTEVAIYYIQSLGSSGEIGANNLNGKYFISFTTNRFREIINDTNPNNNYTTQLNRLILSNPLPSSYYSSPETVEEIRQNAPSNFRSQFSLTTAKSYEVFIKTNFSNIIHDVVIMNNQEYLDSYIKYFYNLGLTKPQFETRALFNQIRYADSCNFNNIYCVTVPKTKGDILSYVVPEQKKLILNTIKNEKTLTSEIIISDPVYMAIDFAISQLGDVSLDDINNTSLMIEKEPSIRINDVTLHTSVFDTIRRFFDKTNNKLGQTININQLNAEILSINGVRNIFTTHSSGVKIEGLQAITWNKKYNHEIIPFNGSYQLDVFQFPYFHSIEKLKSRIVISN
jgi:hypothetical protein